MIVGLGAVGFIDDYLGIRKQRNLGLRKRGKLAGQLFVGSGFALLCLHWVHVSTHLSFTRDLRYNLGSPLWFLWAVLVIIGTMNGVNLTDGLDGLCAGTSMFVFAVYTIIAFWQFRHLTIYHVPGAQALDMATISAAMLGGCAGFLWWNAAPAQIIMGDTGSMAIGAAVSGLALLTRDAAAAADPRRALHGRDTVGDRAGHLVPVLRAPRAAHVADPSPLRGRGVAGDHGDGAVLALRGTLRGGGSRSLLRRLPATARGARVSQAQTAGAVRVGIARDRAVRAPKVGAA